MLSKRQFIHRCAGCAAGLFTTSLLARDGVEVGKTSAFANLVPAAVRGISRPAICANVEAGA